jgi:hypothetical protein
MITDKISALKRTQLFGELKEPDLRALAERAVERRLARDEILFVAGDEARGLYVIASRALRAFREGVDGREQAPTSNARARPSPSCPSSTTNPIHRQSRPKKRRSSFTSTKTM